MKARLDAILKSSQAAYLDSLLPARDALLDRMSALAAAGGPDVDDVSGDGEIAGVFDGIEAGVAVVGEPLDEFVTPPPVEGVVGFDGEDEFTEEVFLGGGLHQGLDGGDDEISPES